MKSVSNLTQFYQNLMWFLAKFVSKFSQKQGLIVHMNLVNFSKTFWRVYYVESVSYIFSSTKSTSLHDTGDRQNSASGVSKMVSSSIMGW